MTEGFVAGGAIIAAGLALQVCVGPVVWNALAWPVNTVVLAALLLVIVLAHVLRDKVYICRYLSTIDAAVPALIYTAALTLVMGLTRQKTGGGWLHDMLSFWPFVLTYLHLVVILGVTILKRIVKLRRELPFLLNHLGLFVALVAATLGNADLQRVKMITAPHTLEWRAFDADMRVVEMPIAVELKRFIMETYDDGTPRRFASDIEIVTRSGKEFPATVDVNQPVTVDGWKIYQFSYDTALGSESQTSILEFVRDPWLPAVYAGFFMMLAGALLLLTYTRWSYKRLLPISLLVAAALFCVSYFMPVIRSTKLVPALQSPWFTPHILVYIVCYSLMGAAAVMAIYLLIKKKSVNPPLGALQRFAYEEPFTPNPIDNLIYIGLTFMTFGMLFGAFWAKEAWGHYWSWDPKETWAAITWCSYLVYIHYRRLPTHRPRLALALVLICFVLLQMCWWGINYLPAAQGASIHTY